MKKALISVSDKTGLVEFAKDLSRLGIELLSTGGTAKLLQENGLNVTEVAEYTKYPEMMDGRVKTLHPKIHGGILAVRDNKDHMKKAEENEIKMIDMVVVNLYPFEKVIRKEDVKIEEAIENIYIGGPSMVRSAAKNHKYVTVVVDPKDYQLIIEELKKNEYVTEKTRQYLAVKAFARTADYDSTIDSFLSEKLNNQKVLRMGLKDGQRLRYGENPHQTAFFFRDEGIKEPCVSNLKQLHGKEMSYNNIMDTDGALELVKEFDEPCCAIIKHANPCGVAVAENISDAYKKARETDPVSAFGGIVAFNRPVDKKTAEEIGTSFVEVVVAPSFEKSALSELQKKKNIRILESGELGKPGPDLIYKKVTGGLLVQDKDIHQIHKSDLKVVTKREPTEDEMKGLLFAWKVVKHIKSNAIVYTKKDQTIGIGAGQMSRVDSSEVAAMKAAKQKLKIKGTVLASDAFFPFPDAVEIAAEAGVTAVIQPGGSIRDEEVIKAADKHNIAMVFTGFRCFRH